MPIGVLQAQAIWDKFKELETRLARLERKRKKRKSKRTK
jgi:hypothetical protein